MSTDLTTTKPRAHRLIPTPQKLGPDRCNQHRLLAAGRARTVPEGIPNPAQAEPQSGEPATSGPATAAEWREEQLDGMDRDLRFLESWNRNLWRGISKYAGPRFRFADDDISRLDSILHRFRSEVIEALERAVVVDKQQSPRPSFLRLAVDNSA
jgi:hypothetical protein